MNWNDVKHWDSNNLEYWRGSVAGVTFVEGYPNNLKLLKEELDELTTLQAIIKRNPENPYDANACEVWVEDQFIGHLARDVAKEIAPRMDAGEQFNMVITYIGASSDQPDKLGAVYTICPLP